MHPRRGERCVHGFEMLSVSAPCPARRTADALCTWLRERGWAARDAQRQANIVLNRRLGLDGSHVEAAPSKPLTSLAQVEVDIEADAQMRTLLLETARRPLR